MSDEKALAGTGTSPSNPAQFVNLATTYIDGSAIYGSDATTAAALRRFSDGQLKTSAGNLLPYNTMGLPMENPTGLPPTSLFAAGDVRANENLELINITTLFVREHNYQAAQLKQQNPNWTDEQLYQGARQIVIGEIQHITFDHWLPVLTTSFLPVYTGYKANINPSIYDEFAGAAFRLHTLINDHVKFLDDNGQELLPTLTLAQNFFRPDLVNPTEYFGNLKYMSSDLSQQVDLKTVEGLRNNLVPGAPIVNNVHYGAHDLIAADIQRGRDQGLPTYNQARTALGLRAATTFAQITDDPELQAALQQIYGSPDNVELFVALMGETHKWANSNEEHSARTLLGETEAAIINKQFQSLRDGDRFFYKNSAPPELVSQIQNTTLTQIISRNGGPTNLQPNVFLLNSIVSGKVSLQAENMGIMPMGMTLAGMKVDLIQDGQIIATTTTDRQGNYRFNDVAIIGYATVRIELPTIQGMTFTGSTSVDVEITKGQIFNRQPRVVDFALKVKLTPSAKLSFDPLGPTERVDSSVQGALLGARVVKSPRL